MPAAATDQHQLPTVNRLEPLASGAGCRLAISRADWARGKASDWPTALFSRRRGGVPQGRGVSENGACAVGRARAVRSRWETAPGLVGVRAVRRPAVTVEVVPQCSAVIMST